MGLSAPGLRWMRSLPSDQVSVAWKREMRTSHGQANSLSGDLRPNLSSGPFRAEVQVWLGSGPCATSSTIMHRPRVFALGAPFAPPTNGREALCPPMLHLSRFLLAPI